MKILLCFGTRPEAIKMAPLYHEFKKTKHEIKICVTAQHRQMLDQVLDFFEIIPDYDLDLMEPNQTLNALSSRILKNMDKVLMSENPDIVFVHGDTTTSSMVALAAFHRNIKVGHVEAGLRTYEQFSPFPEEINRQLTARVATFHFAPTIQALENLKSEKLDLSKAIITGNTVIDALLWTKRKINTTNYFNTELEVLKTKITKKFILVTLHRRENFGEGLENILKAINQIVKENDIQVVFPVHFNPNVREKVDEIIIKNENFILINPVEYPVMVWLLDNCKMIISDSGGIQEEAPTFKKPIIVTRNTSERPEGEKAGYSFLVGTDYKKIVTETNRLLNQMFNNSKENPYGNGKACEMIVKYFENAPE